MSKMCVRADCEEWKTLGASEISLQRLRFSIYPWHSQRTTGNGKGNGHPALYFGPSVYCHSSYLWSCNIDRHALGPGFRWKNLWKAFSWGSCHHRTWWDVALFAFKKNKLWLWKAYCRDTGQLIDWECGNRDQSTLARLMARLRRWSVWFFCTDNWKVYPREIPEDDLIQGKRGTVRIERNNARQRHWFARFKRKSQVVSRSLRMVDLTISLFARFHVNGQREDILSFF